MTAFDPWWTSPEREPGDFNDVRYPAQGAYEVASMLGTRHRVCEIGAGQGRLLDLMRTIHVGTFVGVDVIDSPRDDIVRCDGCTLDGLPFDFDGFYSVQLFQHVDHATVMSYLSSARWHAAAGAVFVMQFVEHAEVAPRSFPHTLDAMRDLCRVSGWSPLTASFEAGVRGWTWLSASAL